MATIADLNTSITDMDDHSLYNLIKSIRLSRRNPIKIASKTKPKGKKKITMSLENMMKTMTEDKKAEMIAKLEESL